MKVGIIGGTGQMGSLFSRVFTTAGHEVIVSGRRTELTSKDLVLQSDLIIVSVPIHSTIPVIQEITPYLQKGQLLCDFTSLKQEPVRAMMQTNADVIGLHPMFGPTVNSIQGQTIVMTPGRCSEDQLLMLTTLFTSQGARVTRTTPEHHDKMMAIIQGLTHFKALVMAETMRRLGVTPQDTESFMSPIYRIETSVAGRILAQDPMLYADILHENPEIPKVLDTCQKAATDLSEIIRMGNMDQFVEQFLADRIWFGEYCNQSLKETDRLIAAMVQT
jgi:prephenate dehydrogenase